MLMGIKILLALVVFFFASVLSGRSPKFEKFRRQSMVWNLVLIVLVSAIVAIGSYLKVAQPPVAAATPAPATAPPTNPPADAPAAK